MDKSHANMGVKCEVNSCVHYISGDLCSAQKIHVMSKSAKTTKETDCGTFEYKS